MNLSIADVVVIVFAILSTVFSIVGRSYWAKLPQNCGRFTGLLLRYGLLMDLEYIRNMIILLVLLYVISAFFLMHRAIL